MSKPRMVIYIEDGILRDIIVDPGVDIEILVVDEDSDAEDQYLYSFWSKTGNGDYVGELSVDPGEIDVQFDLATRNWA